MARKNLKDNGFYQAFEEAYRCGGIEYCNFFLSHEVENYDIHEFREAMKFIRTDFIAYMSNIDKISEVDCDYQNKDPYEFNDIYLDGSDYNGYINSVDNIGFVRAIFDSLCEYDYDEALHMLRDQLESSKYPNAFKKELAHYIEKARETKRTNKNTDIKGRIYDTTTLINETAADVSKGRIYYLFIRNYLPFKQSLNYMNRYEELSKLELWQIEGVFQPLGKHTYAEDLGNYFELLRHKGINYLINGVGKILEVTASEERVSVLEEAFGHIFDYSMTHDKRLELKSKIAKNNILSKLTRGELQDFILNSHICCETKLLLLDSQDKDLFDYLDTYQNLESRNKGLKNILDDYKDILTYYPDKRFDRVDCHKDYELEIEDIDYAAKRLEEYEIANLKIILGNDNPSQILKWLFECYPSKKVVEDYSGYCFREEDYDIEPIYYYHKFIQQIIHDYYSSIGIDYSKTDIINIPRQIMYGVEIEEVGVKNSADFATSYFTHTCDTSLAKYIKGRGKSSKHYRANDPSGEYVSDIFYVDGKNDYDYINEQIDLLNFFGARENSTCGFHVHLSSQYQENYEYKPLIEHYGMPDEYDPDDYKLDDSKDHEYYLEMKDLDGFLVPHHIAREIYDMQNVLIKKLHVYKERLAKGNYCEKYKDPNPVFDEKFKFVNFSCISTSKGIEFRFFNLPDYLDKKVTEAYVDFATNYFAYLEEGNNTFDYAKEAYKEVTGNDFEKMQIPECYDYVWEILLGQLDLKEDTRIVFDHLDEIFELYTSKPESLWENDEAHDYYTKYDKTIEGEYDEDISIFDQDEDFTFDEIN